MLESLLIRNFQIHKTMRIEFDPLVTMIVGDNDRGKSALLRALRWCCLNVPSGDSFRRHGSKFTKAVLKVDEHTITRKKGTANEYRLDGEEFRAFGSDPPAPISALLNIDEASFARQHSSAYWFSDTPGQVGKALNRIINLDLIDRSLANVASALRKARATKEVSERRLEEAERRQEELAYVPDMAKSFRILEEQAKQLEAHQQQIDQLYLAASTLEETEEKARRSKGAGKAAMQLMGMILALEETEQEATKLESIIEEVEQQEQELCQLKESASSMKAELKDKTGNLCPICKGPLRGL